MIKVKDLLNKLDKDLIVVSYVYGDSMLPFLKSETKVIIAKAITSPKIYDVILYKNEDKFILHRVIKEAKGLFAVRGDNSVKSDYVKKDDVLGILTGYFIEDKYVEVDEHMNKKYYLISQILLPFRIVKNCIKRLIKK